MAISLLLALTLLGMTAHLITTSDLKISGRYRLAERAFYTTEAGFNRLLGHYTNTPLDLISKKTLSTLEGELSWLSTTKPSTANFGSDLAYWLTDITYSSSRASKPIPPCYFDVTSHGTAIGSSSESEIMVRHFPVYSSPFYYGIFADTMSLENDAYMDSYNSSVAPWALPSQLRDHCYGGTNATGAAAVVIKNAAKIYGHFSAGKGGAPGTVISITNDADILGSEVAADCTKVTTAMADPGGGTADTIDISGTTTKTLTAGSYRVPYVKISNDATLNINGAVTLYVDGDFTMENNGEVAIQSGSLTVYLSGTLTVKNYARVNNDGTPGDVIIYGTSTSTTVLFDNEAILFGAVYSPDATVTMQGNTSAYGAMIGTALEAKNTAKIHYDEALLQVNSLQGASWKEVF